MRTTKLRAGILLHLFMAAVALCMAACGGGGGSDPTPPANAPPTNVQLLGVLSLAVGQVSASWLPASDDSTSGANLRYQLHASTQEGFVPTSSTLRLETTGLVSGTISTGLTGGARYYIKLVAIDAQGATTIGQALAVTVASVAATPVPSVAGAACNAPLAALSMTCTLTGTDLPPQTSFSASNCSPDPMVAVSGGSATQRQFTCTPFAAGLTVNVSYVVPGMTAVAPPVPPAAAGFRPSPQSDVFVWPVDLSNPSRGHFGECLDTANPGCFWLSDADRTASTVWRDVTPFQAVQETSGWHLGADYNLGNGSDDAGKPVHAISAGTVVNVVTDACTWGNAIFLRHETSTGSVTSMYAHVDWLDAGAPALNAMVERGEQIAKVGDGVWSARVGCVAGNWPYHLHFQFRRGTDASMGTGYTSNKLAADALGPQGQVDPNTAIAAAAPGTSGRLNDTGITASKCFQAGSDNLVICTSADALALNDQQDGMAGRDVLNNDDSDGEAGFSFSLVPKPNGGYYDKTECVRDNVTGQIWEGKTADGGIRDSAHSYTYWGDGRSGDASAYVGQVNAAALCGYNDWRLPRVRELQAIVNYGVYPFSLIPTPTIDMAWFPNTQLGVYLSSSPYAGHAGDLWLVLFGTGQLERDGPGSSVHVRLVR